MERWVSGKIKTYLLTGLALFVSPFCWGQTVTPDSVFLWNQNEAALRFSSEEFDDLSDKISYTTHVVAYRETMGAYQSWTWRRVKINDNILQPVDIQILVKKEEPNTYFLIFRQGESKANITSELESSSFDELLEWMEDFGFELSN